jgi:hypothetical protein
MNNSSVKLEKISVRSKAATCFSKQVAFVPASSDAASIQRRRNDFRVRLNYECADCSENGGSILMLTFTYNDESLPHLPFLGSLSKFQGIECFRRSDFKRLYNNLRDWCAKRFRGAQFRYFTAFEKGTNTKRAHLHTLFLIPKNVNKYEFAERCRYYWYTSFKYGMMFPNVRKIVKKDGVIVSAEYFERRKRPDGSTYDVIRQIDAKDSTACAFYASKYVTKDMSFFNDPQIQALQEYINSQDPKERRYLRHIISDYMPRPLFSKSFGFSVIERNNLYDPDSLKHAICNGIPLIGAHGAKYTALPYFAIRKLFYDSVKLGDTSISFDDIEKPLYTDIINDYGCKMLPYMCRFQYDSLLPLAEAFIKREHLDISANHLALVYMSYGCSVEYSNIEDYIEDLISYKLRFALLDSSSLVSRVDGSLTFLPLDSHISKYIEYPFYEDFKTFVYSVRSAPLYKYADIVNYKDIDYEA